MLPLAWDFVDVPVWLHTVRNEVTGPLPQPHPPTCDECLVHMTLPPLASMPVTVQKPSKGAIRALVLSPTRELATQIVREFKRISPGETCASAVDARLLLPGLL